MAVDGLVDKGAKATASTIHSGADDDNIQLITVPFEPRI